VSERICQFEGCNASLDGMRAQARYCSPRHRAAAHREKPHSTPPEQPRRASRDGKGTHVYLTPDEIDFLKNSRMTFRGIKDWQAHLNLGSKLARATRRLAK
jgi:hypothetical protein